MTSRCHHRRSSMGLDMLEERRLMANIAVTSAANDGAGSLRWAITQANATPAADVISFQLGVTKSIQLLSPLPLLTTPMTIDGSTQSGYAGQPLIRVDGINLAANPSGFGITAPNVTIRGLAICNFKGDGVTVASVGTNATIRECHIGVSASGDVAAPNTRGVWSFAGSTRVQDSVVSGNTLMGVRLEGSFSNVTGSTIGLARDRLTPMPNGGDGVCVVDGGFHAVTNNVIGSNAGYGVHFTGDASLATVDGNTIGMSGDRLARRGNLLGGVRLHGVSGAVTDNRIGTDASTLGIRVASEDVTITGNNIGFGNVLANDFGGTVGIQLENAHRALIHTNQIGHFTTGIRFLGTNDVVVRGNGIGTLLGSDTPELDNVTGIEIESGSNNTIGSDGNGNHIMNNTGAGVWIRTGVSNPVLGNVFRNNGGLDIDLGPAGVTPMDHGYPNYDADGGANNLQNSVLWAAHRPYSVQDSTQITHAFWVSSPDDASYRVDVYESFGSKGWTANLSRHITTETIAMTGPNAKVLYLNLPHQIDGTLIAYTLTRLVNGKPTDTSEPSDIFRVEGPPAIKAMWFNPDKAQDVQVRFSRDVSASIQKSDLALKNLANNQNLAPLSVSYDATTNTATFSFGQALSPSNYRATLNRQGVTAVVTYAYSSTSTFHAEGNNTLDFHVLPGDANGDKTVGFDDLLVVSQNYGTSGKGFSQGNFDYDPQGKVDFSDLLIVSQKYGTTALTATPMPEAKVSGQTFARNRRIADSVL